jgi:hypothetical protein
MHEKLSAYQWSYIHPTTHEEIKSSKHGILLTMTTDPDESVRKACFG